jgi:hypothetical protein
VGRLQSDESSNSDQVHDRCDLIESVCVRPLDPLDPVEIYPVCCAWTAAPTIAVSSPASTISTALPWTGVNFTMSWR